jgi:hypothetical protein
MSHKPPSKEVPRSASSTRHGRVVADPALWDAHDVGATWPGDEDEEDERDAIRDLEDPTYGFPIGSLARTMAKDEDQEATEVPRVGGARTPSRSVARPALSASQRSVDTPTMEFAAIRTPGGPEVAPARSGAPAAPRRSSSPAPAAPARRSAPPGRERAEAFFDPGPPPIDNSQDEFFEFDEVPDPAPIDPRVVVLLIIFALCVLVLIALLVLAAVVYL